MQLVDEEDHVAFALANLLHHLLHALFEFAAVLRSRDQTGEVQGYDSLVLQQRGDVSAYDAQCEALGDGCLTNARLTDQTGIVLGTAAQDLHYALDLALPADHGVQTVVPRELGKVSAEFVEGLGLGRSPATGAASTRLRLGLVVLERHDFAASLFQLDAQLGQHAAGKAVALTDEAKQQVLRSDVVVVEVSGLVIGQIDHSLGTRSEGHILAGPCVSPRELLFHLSANAVEADTQLLKDPGSDAVALAHEAEQQMLRGDVTLPELLSFLLGVEDDLPCTLRKSLPHI